MRKAKVIIAFLFGVFPLVATADLIVFEDVDGGLFIAPGATAQCVAGACGDIVSSEGYGLGNFVWTDSTDVTDIAIGGMGAHSLLTFSFDLAIIDSWDGSTTAGGLVPPDFFNVVLDGVTVFSETFDNFILADGSASATLSPTLGPAALGFNAAWNDSLYQLSFTILHSSPTLSIQMFASGGGFQGGMDESWAWDNFTISTSVPEPGTLALLGIGLLGIGFARRRTV